MFCEQTKALQAAKKMKNYYPYAGFVFPQMSMCILYGLGRGGNGTVYLAEECDDATMWDCKSGSIPPKQYAMKVIEKTLYDPSQVHLIAREYKYHTRVASHPNILQPHSMLETKDAVILTSEYIRDGDFKRFLHKYGHFLCRDNILIKTIFLQLLDAVAHMHEQGVYHGDLKPENILCKHQADSSRLIIADFGASTDRPYIYHQNGYIIGTEEYAPPECLPGPRGGRCVFPHAIDIWSLGIILFTICTDGLLPWRCAHPDLDPYYQAFTTNPDYFLSRWKLSRSTRTLLTIIWQSRPENRVNIHQLRGMVEVMIEFTTYPDSSRAIISAKRHAVLHTYFWLAGRCALPREIKMPEMRGPQPCQVGSSSSSSLSTRFPKLFGFQSVAAYLQKSKSRINKKLKVPLPITTGTTATAVATAPYDNTPQFQLIGVPDLKLPVEIGEAAFRLLDGLQI